MSTWHFLLLCGAAWQHFAEMQGCWKPWEPCKCPESPLRYAQLPHEVLEATGILVNHGHIGNSPESSFGISDAPQQKVSVTSCD